MNDTEFRLSYLPGESDTGMFGGNSNWRGPIWMPVNGLMIRALMRSPLLTVTASASSAPPDQAG